MHVTMRTVAADKHFALTKPDGFNRIRTVNIKL